MIPLSPDRVHTTVIEAQLPEITSLMLVLSKVEVIIDRAADSLANLHPDVLFDLVFIDADKLSNARYFTEAKRLVRKTV